MPITDPDLKPIDQAADRLTRLPQNLVFGSGRDALVLQISQDAYQGDAQYTLSVDGVQVDGILTAIAERRFGQDDTVTVRGDFGSGHHDLTVDFLNDAWGGTPDADRNLFVDRVTLNGAAVADGVQLYSGGPQSLSFAVTALPRTETIGSGPDAVVLQVNQDAYQGDAQYIIRIDGVPVDGTLTASALRASGTYDTVTVLGDFTPGPHTVAVDFLNDAWGGTPETDRNLYVHSATFEGVTLPDSAVGLLWSGSRTLGSFTEAPPMNRSIGSGPDALVLSVFQDDWLGNAQYTVSIDGQQVDGILTASAERQFGRQPDLIIVYGDFHTGPHILTIDFLNDAWGGTPAADRNLYLGGVRFEGSTLPGQSLPDSSLAFYVGGPQSIGFSIATPEPLQLVGTDGPDRLQEGLGHGDAFLGGGGADSFAFGVGIAHNFPFGEYFGSTLGTGVGPGDRDVILDFQQGEDVIDLSTALQFSRRASQVDSEFQFIGTAPFSGTPELNARAEVRYEVSGETTIIQMDASGLSVFRGDGTVDAEIELAGVFSLTGRDFIL